MKRSLVVIVGTLALTLVGCKQFDDAPMSNCWGGKCDGDEVPTSPGSVTEKVTWDDRTAGPKATPGSKWEADWTLLVYAANDDTNTRLVEAFDEDIEELRKGLGGSAMFRILVQRDYASHQKNGTGNDHEVTGRPSERFGIYRERIFHPTTLAYDQVEYRGETNSNDPNDLAEFLEWGIDNYPAKRYWVIITGHGDGWNGLAFDATNSGQRMRLRGLHTALQRAANKIGFQRGSSDENLEADRDKNKIDVLQFDACHMGSFEAAVQLSDVASYMVASQEVVPNAGHPYSSLRLMAQDRTGSGPKWAVENIVTDYVRSYVKGVSTQNRNYVGKTVSSVGLDLSQLDDFRYGLPRAIADFVRAVQAERPPIENHQTGETVGGGFTCSEVAQIAKVARERANLVGQYVPLETQHDSCGAAKKIVLQPEPATNSPGTPPPADNEPPQPSGKRVIKGNIEGNATCSLPGTHQEYFKVLVRSGLTYTITLNPDFDGRLALFRDGGCQCSQSDETLAAEVKRRHPKTISFEPTVSGPSTLHILVESDTIADTATGRYFLTIDEHAGRATAASRGSVDLVALFEAIVGTKALRERDRIRNCAFTNARMPDLPEGFISENIRKAANRVLDKINRPYVAHPNELQPGSLCGVPLRYGGQYRKLVGFAESEATRRSPFVVEAHKVDNGTQRATSLSILFGDVFPLTGNGDLDAYKASSLGMYWLPVMQACVDEVEKCRAWKHDSGLPNPCTNLPF